MKLDVPRFDDQDPVGWIFKICQFFDYQGLPDHERITVASFYMDNPALSWYQWMTRNGFISSKLWCSPSFRRKSYTTGAAMSDNQLRLLCLLLPFHHHHHPRHALWLNASPRRNSPFVATKACVTIAMRSWLSVTGADHAFTFSSRMRMPIVLIFLHHPHQLRLVTLSITRTNSTFHRSVSPHGRECRHQRHFASMALLLATKS